MNPTHLFTSSLQPDFWRFLRVLILLFALEPLGSCAYYEHRGYLFDEEREAALQEGVTSKERVLRIMGSPSSVLPPLAGQVASPSGLSEGDQGAETWLYYSERLRRVLFFRPRPSERKLLLVRFDRSGLISELRRLSLADEDRHFAFSSNRTEVPNHGTSFFKAFFGNVGQVRAQ